MSRNNNYLIGNQFAKGSGPNSGSFRKGMIPWNKGVKGIRVSPETEFKPGAIPVNHVEVGTVRVRRCKNGTLRTFIKVAEHKVWKLRSVAIWEARFGLLPKGMMIHHIDGNPLNDTLSNLCATTRAGHIEFHRRELHLARLRPGGKVGKGYVKISPKEYQEYEVLARNRIGPLTETPGCAGPPDASAPAKE